MLQAVIDLVVDLLPTLISAAAAIIVAMIQRRGTPHTKRGKHPTDNY